MNHQLTITPEMTYRSNGVLVMAYRIDMPWWVGIPLPDYAHVDLGKRKPVSYNGFSTVRFDANMFGPNYG